MPLSEALTLARLQGSLDTSLRANITVDVTAVTRRATTHSTTTGPVQLQLKPATISDAKLQIRSGGKTVPMEEIETGSTTYLKLASVAGFTGKPWVAVSSSSVASPGVGAGQGVNPLTSMQFLSVSKNLRTAGTAVVNGVFTTRYAGSYPASAMLTGLPAKLRKTLAAKIKNAGPVTMSLWISANGRLQKVLSTETIPPQTITTIFDITAVNVPLHIAIPPPSQVAHIPANALGGL
jgi:hypothetical protein